MLRLSKESITKEGKGNKMTKIIIALLVVVVLVVLGYLSEAFKKLLKVITEVIL